MLALEGELLRDLDRAQFRQGLRWWQCVFRKNATIKLTFGRLAEFLYSVFFLSFLVTLGAFFKKMSVVAADDGLAGGLLQGGMLSLVGRWLLIDVLQVRTILHKCRTHGRGIGGLINF